jgi:hypothetical protein
MGSKLMPVIDLLRVVRKGRAVKDMVDIAIDRSGEVENLRDSIEDARLKAEDTNNEAQRKEFTNMGMYISAART